MDNLNMDVVSISGGIPEGMTLPKGELTVGIMEINQLTEQIKVVAEARRIAQQAGEAKKTAHEEWEHANQALLDEVIVAQKVCSEAEAKLRELTLQAYAETGNKAPAPGVSVKIFSTLNYDPKEALKWAMNHQIALSLDKKSFEGFAKATPLEFVSITEEPRAQIATNL